MPSIPLLGGPEHGTLVSVAEGHPPSYIVRDEVTRVPGSRMSFARWLTRSKRKFYGQPKNVKAEIRQQYEKYCRKQQEGTTEVKTVYYLLVRWGNPWQFHYVHPDHPAAQFALSC